MELVFWYKGYHRVLVVYFVLVGDLNPTMEKETCLQSELQWCSLHPESKPR